MKGPPIIVRIVCEEHGDLGPLGEVRETRQGAVLDQHGYMRGSAGWSVDGRPVSIGELKALRDQDPVEVPVEFQGLQQQLREQRAAQELLGARRRMPGHDKIVLETFIGSDMGDMPLRCLRCGEKAVPFATLWTPYLSTDARDGGISASGYEWTAMLSC